MSDLIYLGSCVELVDYLGSSLTALPTRFACRKLNGKKGSFPIGHQNQKGRGGARTGYFNKRYGMRSAN